MDAEMILRNRAQVTIFIILGLIVVVIFAMIFIFLRETPEVKVLDEKNPQAAIESCTKEAVEEAIKLLSRQGGDITPGKDNYLMFEGEEVVYLCYIDNNYEPCINQRPLLIEHIENEITDFIRPKIQDCFNELQERLEERYDVETSDMEIKTKLWPRNVAVEIKKKFKMSRGGEVRELKDFKMSMVHPIYDLAEISMEIVNQEIKYCNFDELGYMIVYPGFDVVNFITGEADVVYEVKDRATEQKFKFAVRSCILPPGV